MLEYGHGQKYHEADDHDQSERNAKLVHAEMGGELVHGVALLEESDEMRLIGGSDWILLLLYLDRVEFRALRITAAPSATSTTGRWLVAVAQTSTRLMITEHWLMMIQRHIVVMMMLVLMMWMWMLCMCLRRMMRGMMMRVHAMLS